MKFATSVALPMCLAASNSFFVKEKDVVAGMDENCPTVKHYTAEFHQNHVCDRAAQNAAKKTLGRGATQAKLHNAGTDGVPSEHTTFCPQTVNPLTNPEATIGFDTVWLVENTATTPVVISYMIEQTDGTFKEVSALDAKISPPHHDPKAILQPNEWKSIQTYEGHVFHVREIMPDGSMGQVLMQHRVGLVPVTNKYGHELDCDPSEADPEPLVEVAPGQLNRDPNFAREAPQEMRPCNTLDVGFRNEVGCPINAYYTGMYQLKGVAKPRGEKRFMGANATEVSDGHTPKSCHEVFKFHLGLKEKTNNFMFDWNSKTKYEGTYVGHNFVFRYAKDERIVVDSIAMHPTQVIDCPGLKNQVNAASVASGEAIMAGVVQQDYDVSLVLPHQQHLLDMQHSNATQPSLNNTSFALLELPSPSQRRRALASAADGAARTLGTSAHSL